VAKGVAKVATFTTPLATLLIVASDCWRTTNFKVASKVAKSVRGRSLPSAAN
jgi:hypothetical protein